MVQRCSQIWRSRAGHGMILCFVLVRDNSYPLHKAFPFKSSTSAAVRQGGLSWGHMSLFTFPLWWIRILPQPGSPKNEAVRFRYIQLPLLPNKWVLSKEIQFLLFWGLHRVIVWWLLLAGGGRQFPCWIAPFRYKKAQDVKKKKNWRAEEAYIHYFRLEETPYSKKPEQLNLFILSRRRLSGELITKDKHLMGKKYQALKGSLI